MYARAILLRPASPPLYVAAGLLSAFVAGALIAYNMPVGLKLLAAAGYVLIVFMNLPAGLGVWIVVNFFDATPTLEFAVKAAGIVLALAWIGTLSENRARIAELWRRHARLLIAVLALLVWIFMTLAWSERPETGPTLWQWPVAVVVFFIVATTVRTEHHVRIIAAAFVFGALLSTLSGLGGGETVFSGFLPSAGSGVNPAGRVQGGVGGANFLATGIVCAMALAGGLAAARLRHSGARAALVAAVGILGFALVSTQSRGGLLALIASSVAALFLFKRQRKVVLCLVIFALGATAVSIAASPQAAARLWEDTRGGSGRIDTWRVAREVAFDHPIVGVGVHNLNVHALRYIDDLSAVQAASTLARKQVGHNVYIEMLAETGVIGLSLFLVVVVGTLRAAMRAARHFDALGDHSLAALARAVVVAMIGSLTASLFLSGGGGERLWVLFALGPALLGIASRR
jgi:O-antigen ligase